MIRPEWEEDYTFILIAEEIIESNPEDYGHVDASKLTAYKCVNKTPPENYSKLYDLSGESEPEALTNTKRYFVKFFADVWDGMNNPSRILVVESVLRRIPRDNSGKVLHHLQPTSGE